jgi:hypothetical protein
MLTVFGFLIVLVLSMAALRLVAQRLPSGETAGERLDTAAVAAAVAAILAQRGAHRANSRQMKD